MSFLDDAFEELGFDEWQAELTYSGRFNGYNANIRKQRNSYDIRMSNKWEPVDEEIQKGCIQTILRKLKKSKKTTPAIKLYNQFLKSLGEYAERKPSDPYLQERFEVLNDMYFSGLMTQPNLEWGQRSLRQLGRYEYSTDTVRISTVLKDNQDLLDYVLYHELLHKKHKFTCTGTQTRHHTKEFRQDEAKFWLEDAEKKLKAYIRTKKPKKKRRWF